jgi:hypothetical protein
MCERVVVRGGGEMLVWSIMFKAGSVCVLFCLCGWVVERLVTRATASGSVLLLRLSYCCHRHCCYCFCCWWYWCCH